MLPFLYSPIFREYKKGKLARNGLSKMSLPYHHLMFIDFHILFYKTLPEDWICNKNEGIFQNFQRSYLKEHLTIE